MTKTYNLITSLALLLFILVSCKKDDAKPGETILYETDFSKNDGKWSVGSPTSDTYYGYENGIYVLKGSATKAVISRVSEDFSSGKGPMYVEASVKPTYFSENRYGNGGLIWNFQWDGADQSFYVLQVSHNGKWKIDRFNSKRADPWENIVDWTTSTAMNNDGYNTLKVLLDDGKINLYINQSKVYSMASNGIISLNRAGLFANAFTIMTANHFKIATVE